MDQTSNEMVNDRDSPPGSILGHDRVRRDGPGWNDSGTDDFARRAAEHQARMRAEGVQLPAIADRPAPLPAIAGPADLVAAFLAGRKATTLKAYGKDLDDFARFVGLTRSAAVDLLVQDLPNQPGPANGLALAYRAHLTERAVASATIARRLSALRSVVKLARTLGRIKWALEVESPKVEAYRETAGPGRSGIKAIDRAAKELAKASPAGLRDLAIFRLGYDGALRRSEINGLDLEDVELDPERPTVAVVGKGKTQKTRLTLSSPARRAIAAWIEARGREPGPLFVRLDRAAGSGAPRRMDSESINRIIHRLGKKAGVGRGTNAHGLRHAAITEALSKTDGNVVAVQKHSRHADPRTVLRYNDNKDDEYGRIARVLGEDLG